jgi:hypothetical protein
LIWDTNLNKLEQIYEKVNVDKAKVKKFSTKLFGREAA